MSTLVIEQDLTVRSVTVTTDTLSVELSDGRGVSVPLTWFPRLLHGAPEERERWELIGRGSGIHWPDLDEDISLEGLLVGRSSAESQQSLGRSKRGKNRLANKTLHPTATRACRCGQSGKRGRPIGCRRAVPGGCA